MFRRIALSLLAIIMLLFPPGTLAFQNPGRSADLLRSVIGNERTFFLEGIVFSGLDTWTQLKYGLLGEPVYASSEEIVPLVSSVSSVQLEKDLPSQPVVDTVETVSESVTPSLLPMILPQIQLLEVSLKEGEGFWRADGLPRTSVEDVLMAKALVRPDPERSYVVAQALLFDKNRVNLHIVGGTKEPGGDRGVRGPGTIPAEDKPNLLAAWNGGFQGPHGGNSMYGDDVNNVKRDYLPLVDGRASVVTFADGTLAIGEWGRDLTMSSDVVAVRQNLILLVDNCEVSSRTIEGVRTWGYVNVGDTKTFITWRSGIGVTANGDLLVVSGPNLSADSLAKAMWAVGACFAMQLDINSPYVFTSLHFPQDDGSLVAKKAMDNMSRVPTWFSSLQERDFFYLTVVGLN